jgi:hypothetical protein
MCVIVEQLANGQDAADGQSGFYPEHDDGNDDGAANSIPSGQPFQEDAQDFYIATLYIITLYVPMHVYQQALLKGARVSHHSSSRGCTYIIPMYTASSLMQEPPTQHGEVEETLLVPEAGDGNLRWWY